MYAVLGSAALEAAVRGQGTLVCGVASVFGKSSYCDSWYVFSSAFVGGISGWSLHVFDHLLCLAAGSMLHCTHYEVQLVWGT